MTSSNSPDVCFAGTNAKVFPLDVETYTEFHFKEYLFALLFCPQYWPVTCLVIPCEQRNIKERAEAIRVGVTKTHLIYCKERIRTCWRVSCCDEGKVVREIPLHKITDVVVEEPAGGCCPPNMLYTVTIETPGATGDDGRPEIVVKGLSKEDAYRLRGLVMKTTPTRPRANAMRRT